MTTILGNRGQLWTSTLRPHLLTPHLDFTENLETSVNWKIELGLYQKIGKSAFLSLQRDSKARVGPMRKIQVPRCCSSESYTLKIPASKDQKNVCIFDVQIFEFLIFEPGAKKKPISESIGDPQAILSIFPQILVDFQSISIHFSVMFNRLRSF